MKNNKVIIRKAKDIEINYKENLTLIFLFNTVIFALIPMALYFFIGIDSITKWVIPLSILIFFFQIIQIRSISKKDKEMGKSLVLMKERMNKFFIQIIAFFILGIFLAIPYYFKNRNEGKIGLVIALVLMLIGSVFYEYFLKMKKQINLFGKKGKLK